MIATLDIWNILDALAITGGIAFCIAVLGIAAWALMREDNDRPVFPWSARMRVEKAKAGLELDAIEVKRLAIDHQRTRVMQAIQDDDHETVQQLGLPAATPKKPEQAEWNG